MFAENASPGGSLRLHRLEPARPILYSRLIGGTIKPNLALTAAILIARASPAIAAGPMAGGGSGTFKSGGTLGSGRSGSTYSPQPSEPPPTRRYGSTTAPPSTSSTRPLGEERFKPYTGSSVYSNRGGVNAYPDPAKPKGYIDPNGKRRF